MKTWENTTDLLGRALIAAMFLIAGIARGAGNWSFDAKRERLAAPSAAGVRA
jgi:hypothetical protein